MFRKITVLFVSLTLLFSLTGCVFIPSWKQVDVRHDTSEIVSVELYDLRPWGYSGRFYGWDEDIDQMEEERDPIDALDAENYDDFVKDLEKLTFTDHFFVILGAAMDPSYNYYGYTVKITYENGDYDILSRTCQLYDSGEKDIEREWSCDEEKWNTFIEKYFAVDQTESTSAVPAT